MEMVRIIPANVVDEVSQLHVWRSKFFDKAAKCERELRRLSVSAPNDKTHFKTMAERLLAASKDNKKKALAGVVEELIPLIELRAELAHSHFVGFAGGDAGQAMFDNASFSHLHFEKLMVLSTEQRKKAYDRLAWIAGQLCQNHRVKRDSRFRGNDGSVSNEGGALLRLLRHPNQGRP